MPSELDPRIAESLVLTAVSGLWPLPNEKIICTRGALKQAFLAVAQEAYGIGFLAGQEIHLRESTCPGSADRPTWMDIRLDDPAALATHRLRLRPIVLRSWDQVHSASGKSLLLCCQNTRFQTRPSIP